METREREKAKASLCATQRELLSNAQRSRACGEARSCKTVRLPESLALPASLSSSLLLAELLLTTALSAKLHTPCECECVRVRVAANPLEDWPRDIIFFVRVASLLHGLCVQLEADIPFMSIMAFRAQQCLCSRFAPPSPEAYFQFCWRDSAARRW